MKKYLTIALMHLMIYQTFAQSKVIGDCVSIKDTVFLVTMHSVYDGSYPKQSWFVIEESNLLEKINTSSNALLLEKIFSNAIHITEPFIGFERKMWSCYHVTQYDSLYKSFIVPYSVMNKKFQKIGLVNLTNQKVVKIEAVSIIAEFWILQKNLEEINSLNHSFYIKEEWYIAPYYYILKQIFESKKLSKQEIKLLKQYFNVKK